MKKETELKNRLFELTEEEEGIPVVYIRVKPNSGYGYDWFSLKHNNYVSSKVPICECGAVEDLKSPVCGQPDKFRPQSSAAAVGHLIYVFGGGDLENNDVDSTEVSYIDTLRPRDGWKACKVQMSKGRRFSYPVTLDDKRVLLVGGFRFPAGDRPFAQMFNPKKDKWVALENTPDIPPYSLQLSGHAIVKERGETVILMHGFNVPHLYTYNVSTDSWGTRWMGEFGSCYHTGALVNGIYYVLDVASSGPASVVLCGYDLSSEKAEGLPVEILVENDGKEWVPWPDCDDRLPWAKLLACGDNKLGMIWYRRCRRDENVKRLCYYWSVFEMTEDTTDGVVRLAAHPLSQVLYHVHSNCSLLDRMVPVYSYKDRPNSSARVHRDNENVGKQNELSPKAQGCQSSTN